MQPFDVSYKLINAVRRMWKKNETGNMNTRTNTYMTFILIIQSRIEKAVGAMPEISFMTLTLKSIRGRHFIRSS